MSTNNENAQKMIEQEANEVLLADLIEMGMCEKLSRKASIFYNNLDLDAYEP